jgi:hypothetical protein
VTFTGVGTCIIDANQAWDAVSLAGPLADQEVAIRKVPATHGLSWPAAVPRPWRAQMGR